MFPLTDNDPQEIGGYRLKSRLGAGGMGQVYLATPQSGSSSHELVVKVVRSELTHDPTFRARFLREIKLAKKAKGRFLAEVLDFDTKCERPWLAMEYVNGPSLDQRIREHGPMAEPDLRKLAYGLAQALADIHTLGIVHRDLKPLNVMLSGDEPRLIDFGVAKVAQESTLTQLTPIGTVLGTRSYMSPEQVTDGEVTAASDMFALGGVLYFAASGKGPFGPGDDAVFHRIQNMQPKMECVPEGLRALVFSCLSKDPAQRPRPEKIVEALGQVLEPELLPSYEPSEPARLHWQSDDLHSVWIMYDREDLLRLYMVLDQDKLAFAQAVAYLHHSGDSILTYFGKFHQARVRIRDESPGIIPEKIPPNMITTFIGIEWANQLQPQGWALRILMLATFINTDEFSLKNTGPLHPEWNTKEHSDSSPHQLIKTEGTLHPSHLLNLKLLEKFDTKSGTVRTSTEVRAAVRRIYLNASSPRLWPHLGREIANTLVEALKKDRLENLSAWWVQAALTLQKIFGRVLWKQPQASFLLLGMALERDQRFTEAARYWQLALHNISEAPKHELSPKQRAVVNQVRAHLEYCLNASETRPTP